MRAAFGRFPVLRLTAAAVFVLTAGALAQQPQPPPATGTAQQPVFRGGANLVLVDAYPQKDGKIVEGLTPADFQILEDGKPQAVDSIEFVRVEPDQPESARRDPNNLNEMKIQAADPHNRVFVVYLDTGHITLTGSHNIRKPLVDALDRIVGPTDLFGVTTATQRPQDLTLGRRLLTVDEQLSKFWYWGGKDKLSGDATDPAEADLTACFHYYIDSQGLQQPWLVDDGPRRRYLDEILIDRRREDRALTALRDLVVYLPTIREARTVLLVVSNGWLLYRPDQSLPNQLAKDARMKNLQPPLPGSAPVGGRGTPLSLGGGAKGSVSTIEFASCVTALESLASLDDGNRFREMLNLASRSNVSFYPVAADGLVPFDIGSASDSSTLNPNAPIGQTIVGENFNRLRDRADSLRTAAENTDGIAVVDTNDLAKGLRRIVDDVSAYYLLGYYSTNAKFDGRFRKIEVKMTKPGLTVHARRGYMAPLPPAATPAARPSAGGTSATVDVSTALEGLSRLTGPTDVFVAGSVAPAGITAVVELPSKTLLDAAWSGGADVTVDITDASGGKISSASGRIETGARGVLLRLPKVDGRGPWHVAARVKGTGAALDGRGEITAGDLSLVGEATVFRATPSPRSPLRAVADFQFRRTERVHIEWPVLGALDQRTARVLDRRGAPLPVPAALTEREVDGQPAIAVDIQLAPLSEGDYVIELVAGQGANTVRKLVAIRVVP